MMPLEKFLIKRAEQQANHARMVSRYLNPECTLLSGVKNFTEADIQAAIDDANKCLICLKALGVKERLYHHIPKWIPEPPKQ